HQALSSFPTRRSSDLVKESQKEFTKKLASYADCYVNDAFGTAHRAHASTALIAKYFDTNNKMFGYLMEKEVKAVDKILNDIKRPDRKSTRLNSSHVSI